MNEREERRRQTRCSFCGKGQEAVRKLVAGPGVYICDACIDLCQEVLQEDTRSRAAGQSKPSGRMALTPAITLIQLGETVLFAGLAAFGILARHPMFALLGAALLTGKAVTNLLPSEIRYQRRAWVGYATGAAFFAAALALYALLTPGS
jgi:hypothetical protein